MSFFITFFNVEVMYLTGNVGSGKLDLSMGYGDNLYRIYKFNRLFFMEIQEARLNNFREYS